MAIPYNRYNSEALFKKYLLAENASKATIKNYLSDLRHYFGWLHQNKILKEVNSELDETAISATETIEKYISFLKETTTPEKTINRRLSSLRKYFGFCINQGWITINPAKIVNNIHAELSLKETLAEFRSYLEDRGFENNKIERYINDITNFYQL